MITCVLILLKQVLNAQYRVKRGVAGAGYDVWRRSDFINEVSDWYRRLSRLTRKYSQYVVEFMHHHSADARYSSTTETFTKTHVNQCIYKQKYRLLPFIVVLFYSKL